MDGRRCGRLQWGGEVARGASGDRGLEVDRSDGESFGLRRKNPPEKFSCGGWMVCRPLPDNVREENGGGGSGVVEVARGASGVVDRVDRNDGESFGLRRKNPPEKFSGGRRWWPAAG
ncbi:hypothetical protein Tco_0531075 [Tanacetum coccineum]